MKNHLALWAGLSAFFGSLVALEVGKIIANPNDWYFGLAGALFTSVVAGASIYSKQKWDDAKEAREKEK